VRQVLHVGTRVEQPSSLGYAKLAEGAKPNTNIIFP
jgi:hypothetical protein